nr:hypothetical protein [Armatimonas sp.]
MLPFLLFCPTAQSTPVALDTQREALDWHQRGLRAVAQGAFLEAERAFSEVIRLAPASQPETPAQELAPELQNQRALFVPQLSLAAAYNNRGAVRLLTGRLAEAQADLDQAAALQPEWAPPWTNGALLWLERNNAQKAGNTALIARTYGGETPQTLCTLAEAAVRRRHWDSARAALARSAELAPSYPYALQIRALMEEAQGRGRDAERLRMQALALLPQTATSGHQVAWKQEKQLSLGLNERLDARMGTQQARGSVFSSTDLRFHHQAVEGRDNARQNALRLQALSGRVRATGAEGLFVRLVGESGQYPGQQGDLGQSRTQRWGTLGLLRRQSTADSVWMGALTVRGHKLPSLTDRQLGAELRWDGRPAPQLKVTGGLAFMQNERTGFQPRTDSGFPAPSEPNDQLLAPGTTRLLSAYLLVSRQKQPDRLWRAGPVLGWQQSSLANLPTRAAYGGLLPDSKRSSLAVLPYAEWLQPLRPHQHLHALLRPRLAPAAGELLPPNLLPDPLFALPGASRDPSTSDRLVDFFLQGPDSRRWDTEVSVRDTRAPLSWDATLFRKEVRNGFILTGDPRLSGSLPLKAITSASTTGLRLTGRKTNDAVGWEGSLCYQNSGALGLPSLEMSLRADLPPTAALGTPYAQLHYWQSASSTYVPGGFSEGSTSALTLVELGSQRRIGPQRESFVRFQVPLGGARAFFPGYPIAAQLLAGVRQQF